MPSLYRRENMDASIVGYILAGVFGIIVLFGFFVGLARGFKKSFFRLIWLVGTAAILWFVTPVISNYLNSFDITSFGLVINGQTVHKLSDIGVNLLNEFIKDEDILSSQAVQEFAKNLPMMVLNLIVFVVLFFVLRYLLWLIWAPMASKLFDKDKRARKRYEKRIKELKKKGMPITEEDSQFDMPKKSKYRFLGGVVGIVCGLVISAVAFSPIVGLNAIYQNVSANITTKNDEGEEVSFVNSQLDEQTLSYVNSYQDSIASTILKYSGTEFVSDFIFSNMTVADVKGEKVKLANEVSTGVKLYSGYMDVDKVLSDYQNATKEDIDQALASFKQIFFDMEKSQLIYLLGDDLLPIFVERYVIENENFNVEFSGIDVSQLIRDAYNEYKKTNPLKLKEIQKQVESLVDIVQLFNNYDLAAPLIKGEVENLDGFVKLVSTNVVGKNIANADTFSEQFVNKLYNISLLENQYTTIIDSVAKGLYNSLEIEFESNTTMAKDTLKAKFKTILSNAIKFIKYYNDSENLDFKGETNNALVSLGKIIDCVGINTSTSETSNAILTTTSYNNLITFLENKANDFLTDSIGDLSSVTKKLEYVTNWEKELSSLAPLYDSIIKIKNDEENPITMDKVLDGTYTLRTTGIGKALSDILGDGNTDVSNLKSVILTNESMRNIIEVLLDKVDSEDLNQYLNIQVGQKSEVKDGTTEVDDRPTLKNKMLNAIYNKSTKTTEIKNWENELYDLVDVFVYLKKTLIDNASDLTTLSQEENTDLKTLGEKIDTAISHNTKLFVTNENLRAIVEYFLNNKLTAGSQIEDILSVNITSGGETKTVKETVLDNIYNYDDASAGVSKWADELNTLKSAFDGTLKDSGDFETMGAKIGKVLDSISGSKILSSVVVKGVVKHYLDEQTNGLDFATATYSNDTLNPIWVMKNCIDTATSISYETEIQNLLDLVKILNKSDADYPTGTAGSVTLQRFKELGAKFNILAFGDETSTFIIEKSKLVTKDVINCFLGYYLRNAGTEFSITETGIASAIAGIPRDTNKTNDNNDNLNNITNYESEFIDLINLSELVSGESAKLEDIGNNLDDIKGRSIIKYALKGILKFYIDKKLPDNVDWNKPNNYETATAIKANVDKINITAKTESELSNGEVLLNNVEFKKEFKYIQEFTDLTNGADGITITNSGTMLNKLIGVEPISTGTDGTDIYYESKLITKDVITIIIKSVMTSKIDKLGDSLAKEKAVLLDSNDGLVVNVANITNYKLEFGYVQDLVNKIESSTVNITEIATQLDTINGVTEGSTKSVLFSDTVLTGLVKIKFDSEVYEYVEIWNETSQKYDDVKTKGQNYSDTIVEIRKSISADKSFVSLFNELTSLKTKIDTLSSINDVSSFATKADDIATILNDIEAMSAIDGGVIAKQMTTTLTDILRQSGSNETEKASNDAKVTYALNYVNFDAHTKDADNPQYYTSVIAALKSALTNSTST